MRIYWYWPFVRSEELGVGRALATVETDVTLHTIAGRLDHDKGSTNYLHIDASIPATPERSEGTRRWLVSRATTYPIRAVRRQQAVAKGRFDIAHVIYLNYFTDGLSLARLAKKVPLVCTVHDVLPHQSRVPARLERGLLAAQYRSAGTIVVHHPSVGVRLTQEFDVDPGRIHFVPWAVPLVGHAQPVATDVPPRSDAEICTILMFGTLRRNKGVDVLLKAMDLIDSQSIRLVIAGRGFSDIEAQVTAAAHRDPRIRAEIRYLTGPEKDALYRQADLVVLPYSTFSSQSAVLHDAYSHKLPVIVTDVGALGDAVREDQTGWVIGANSVEQLATALEHAASAVDARAIFSNASARVAAERSPAVVATTLLALYKHCLNQ